MFWIIPGLFIVLGVTLVGLEWRKPCGLQTGERAGNGGLMLALGLLLLAAIVLLAGFVVPAGVVP